MCAALRQELRQRSQSSQYLEASGVQPTHELVHGAHESGDRLNVARRHHSRHDVVAVGIDSIRIVRPSRGAATATGAVRRLKVE